MYIQANEQGVITVSGNNWRLFHNGIEVLELAEQDFVVTTGGTTEVFVVDTKAECDAEIAKLNLVIPERIIERYK